MRQINIEMEQLAEEKEKLSAQIESIKNNTLNAEKIANMLQNFDAVFETVLLFELDLMQFGKNTDKQKAFEVNGDTALP